ncbi:2-phospho-L-lactate guanylyltransferase [Pseudonocardia endophytica]|uniref:2-phospho-L-lactate guanylyltransferase n=1 Tax=Pseudonocardia endophytica TaxID=401976 RepID=UPI001FB49F93|nr:2-phospho-L-lactate guanylyltransferase [Pseudonocardia endophytica]
MDRGYPLGLVVPVKPLPAAKTRLRGAADGGVGALTAHTRLVLALAMDTVTAARSARLVDAVVVISSDPAVAMEMGALGAEVVPDPSRGLNGALRRGAQVVRERLPGSAVGALQADLPALRGAELDDALAAAAEAFAGGARQVFCADAPGDGTTVLVAAPGVELDPHFGRGSAGAHAGVGAVPLTGGWPGLRRDVDTSDDLGRAAELGLGSRTVAVLRAREAFANEEPHGCPNV